MSRTKSSGPEVTDAVRALARLTRVVEKACQEGGLSLPQYRLLLFISSSSQRAGEVASRAAVSRPALTGLVDGLEKKGLLRRLSVAGDRRGIRLELTEEGEKVLGQAEEYLSKRLSDLETLSGMPRALDGLAALGRGLDREFEQRIAPAAK